MRELSVNLGRCWYWLMTILRIVWAFFALLVGSIGCLLAGCLFVSAIPPDTGAAVLGLFLAYGIATVAALPTFLVWIAIDFLLVCLGADRKVIRYRDIFSEWNPRRYKWCYFCGRKEICEPKELPNGWTKLNQAGIDPLHAYDCGWDDIVHQRRKNVV